MISSVDFSLDFDWSTNMYRYSVTASRFSSIDKTFHVAGHLSSFPRPSSATCYIKSKKNSVTLYVLYTYSNNEMELGMPSRPRKFIRSSGLNKCLAQQHSTLELKQSPVHNTELIHYISHKENSRLAYKLSFDRKISEREKKSTQRERKSSAKCEVLQLRRPRRTLGKSKKIVKVNVALGPVLTLTAGT